MNGDIINFIKAVKAVELAKRQLAIEEGELRLMKEALTKAFFTEGSDIPESFVIRYEGEVYLVRVDTEGDHAHKIERIGAIIEAKLTKCSECGDLAEDTEGGMCLGCATSYAWSNAA